MTSCVRAAIAYGDSCDETIQCSAYLLSGAVCLKNLCTCGPKYYYIHGRCRPYAGLFETCQENRTDCYVNAEYEAASCDKGVCRCSPGFYQREYRSCRRAAKAIGEECTVDIDCVFSEDAYCDAKRLVCARKSSSQARDPLGASLLGGSDGKKEDEARVGGNCTRNEDCRALGNAICGTRGTCICGRAHFPSSTKLKCVPEIGEPCQSGDPVLISKAVCRSGRWGCAAGSVASMNNQICRKVTKQYGKSCVHDEQCYIFGPDARCQKKKCMCNEESRFIESELFCWTKRSIGEACNAHVDCYMDGFNETLSCTKNVCSCPEGTHVNSNRTACVSTSAEIGMTCELHEDCKTAKSTCANGICACVENYYESDGRCLAGINATCTTDVDCRAENSSCQSSVCTCNKDYVATSTRSCLAVASFNESCEFDVQCSAKVPRAVCSSNEDTEVKSARTEPAASASKVCSCPAEHHYNFEKCFRKRVLGEKCTYLGECYLDFDTTKAVCMKGTCACDWGYKPANKTACVNNSAVRAASAGLVPIALLIWNLSGRS
ncbi:hypothetical protein KM043_006613 [Ampulex compressa]|nr:hypothetical protein KM043_006613 [Ampulex compressa]